MDLKSLLLESSVHAERFEGTGSAITNVVADSRLVVPGSLFVAMPSSHSNTTSFLAPARDAGAVAAIVGDDAAYEEARRLGLDAALLSNQGQSYFAELGRICRAAFDNPSSRLRILAVTGTNGKTTTAYMLRDALQSRGEKVAYLGTLGFERPGSARELANTTPFPVEVWTILKECVDNCVTTLVMEASSHALYQRRLARVSFAGGVFTNLTQDHLDFHGTMEAYADAKKLLFTEYAMASEHAFVGVINTGDAIARAWLPDLPCRVFRYGSDDWTLKIDEVSVGSISGALPEGEPFTAPVGGLFNVQNLHSAAAMLAALGWSEKEIAESFRALSPVPGRFESVPNDLGIGVIVDYAHTPDALEKLLSAAQGLKPKRIITVFGCGGDRDKTKRPKMAAVASRLSDISIVTSDNPRTEDPEQILKDVQSGIEAGRAWESIIDRRQAIIRAIQIAQPDDLVVIAGKGHENYQIIGHTKYPMDDREMAREGLASRA